MAPAPLSLERTALASSIASLVSRIACHPLDTIKSQVQASDARSFAATAAKTLKERGARGLYRGLGAAAVVGTPAGCAYFTSYELFKRRLEPFGLSTGLAHFSAGLPAVRHA